MGKSPALRKVLQLVKLVAARDSTVLLLGETGNGKELNVIPYMRKNGGGSIIGFASMNPNSGPAANSSLTGAARPSEILLRGHESGEDYEK